MSQFRLARISLILAAIGLNAAPALMTSATAQSAPATPATSAAPTKPETVRPELYKLLDPAAVKVLIDGKKFPEVQERLTAAEAYANRTPYENYVIERMKFSLGSASGNEAMTMSSLEAIINSPSTPAVDKPEFILAMGNLQNNAKNYTKAIEWMKRYIAEGGSPSRVRASMSRAYYLNNDLATAKTEAQTHLAELEKAGTPPAEGDLRLLVAIAGKQKDWPAYTVALEKLIAAYPSQDLWSDLLHRMYGKTSFNSRLLLDAYRLESTVLKQLEAETYVNMAEEAVRSGFPVEAKKAVDAGFAANVLGTGADAAKHKSLRDRVSKAAADDAKNIATGEASAAKMKDGTGLVNLGYAYVTMDEFDKGIERIEKGIAKGGLKRPEEAKLKLGMAYVKAGRKDDAIKTFETIKGNDGIGDLARYWTMWLKRPADTAAPVAAAPAAK
ncbi:tetratricopeptide repeat protein [Massilia pseudoviolaceinigra]|uniref:tetratricopeptide repeat protein n=1 Tax=Massilia pseudoviolaceinigra TaxID=3057165 RepID=UPI0027969EEB|nr:tetratricopeptide repeat protein [Massilia sp. CCM 9206]MDQ1924401.1 hypothetical protein [Massilia sp. CCM 9206]